MAAQIRSSIPAKPTIDNASRDDLVVGDVITLEAVPPAIGTTWAWTLVFVPEGSTAVLTPPASASTAGPVTFTADLAGPYLVRLTVDAGLPTEDTQYVRLRALTSTLGLKLVAAGERRDSTGVIPVDVDSEGWANEQNYNLQALESALTGTETLAQTLAAGNTTGGTNIQVDTGDEIIGQTDVVLRSTGAASNIEMNPGATGSVVVNGKLTVTGLIDPTGLVLSEQGSDPASTGAGEGTFWVRNDTPNTPMFTDDAGTDWELARTSGSGTSLVWNVTAVPGALHTAADTEFILITATTTVITLPTPVINHRVAFKLAVVPVDVQVKTSGAGITIDGTDYSAVGLPLTAQWEQFNVISDGSNWFIF